MKLVYFAWLKAKIGKNEEEVTPPPEVTTVGELLDWIKGLGPGYADALSDLQVVRVAVNKEYADHGKTISADDEIALFPPVTGG